MAEINRIHCSYHKCLTVYFKRTFDAVLNRCLPWSGGYRHFNSHLDDFHAGFGATRLASINNRALDLDRLGRFRITRFVRDPRDLVVSGYFYHRSGAESWTTMEAPTESDWYFANGCVPAAMREAGGSFADHLRSVSEEEGLLAELEFRRRHFESMAAWPEHPDVRVFRYEEILGDEVGVFTELAAFHDLGALERPLVRHFARRYSLRRRASDSHVRNPASGQWRRHFTPRLRQAFEERHPGLVRRLGYPES
jgi:hypothetical protein